MKQLKNFSGESSYNATNSDVKDEELVDGVLDRFKGKSEDELTLELIKASRAAKEDGSYNEESLSSFVELVSPYLNDEQREKLYSLINVIKSD